MIGRTAGTSRQSLEGGIDEVEVDYGRGPRGRLPCFGRRRDGCRPAQHRRRPCLRIRAVAQRERGEAERGRTRVAASVVWGSVMHSTTVVPVFWGTKWG